MIHFLKGRSMHREDDGGADTRSRPSIERPLTLQNRGVWLYCAVAGSLLLRISVLRCESEDYRVFLDKWYAVFVEQGRWHGLAGIPNGFLSYFYPPLYLYLISLVTSLPLEKLYAIKAISLVGDYAAAWYVWRLVRRQRSIPLSSVAVALFLFLPTVVMNSAVWGQCDILYTAGLVASLFYVLERRPVPALIAFGIAGSLKPQAFFWCPFIGGLFLTQKLPWKWIWIPVAIYCGLGVPVFLAGGSIGKALFHWGSEAVHPAALNLGAANWYQWLPDSSSEVIYLAGAGLAVLSTQGFIWWMVKWPHSRVAESQRLVSFALLCGLFPPFFLPGVAERYFFQADVLSLVYAFYVPRQWWVPVLVQFASGFAYLPFLFGIQAVPRWLLALVMAAALTGVILHLWQSQKRSDSREGVAT